VAEAHGVTAYLINGPNELDPTWLDGVEKIGITSGASTPDLLVREVIEALGAEDAIPIEGAAEDVSFMLPKGLR
jgi:4-hydroxy-3-methylbut-2-enyl diphosphate reductase